MTHLHTDHAGGLSYFPNADILIHKKEFNNALGFKGLMQGFLNNRFPEWLAPNLFEFNDEPFGPFSKSLKFKNDITIVPTFGHTGTHVSVIVNDYDVNYFIAGDASYSQDNMLQEKVDGVSRNNNVALNTLKNIKNFSKDYSTIYLPSHDPLSAKRLKNKETVFESSEILETL